MNWSLDRLKFVLDHIEDFVTDEERAIRERARSFSAQTGLEQIEDLVEPAPLIQPPRHLLDRLVPFFESGVLISETEPATWVISDIFWRGSVFHVAPENRTSAEKVISKVSPLQIRRAPAAKILGSLGMEFLVPGPEAAGYLVRPAPQIAYILFSNLPDPWARSHITNAHRLINKAFLY